MLTPDDDSTNDATVQVDAAARRALITWAPGVPVFKPWMSTIEQLLSHPEFKPDFAVVSDWRSATGSPDQAFVESFLVFCQSVRRARRLTGRWATVIAASTVDQSGVGRTAELLSSESGSDSRVFTSLEEALAWLATRR
jgi:hypothetical protein